MDNLVEWLTAQLDEDERIAKAATDAWDEKRPRAGQPYDIDGVPVRRHIAGHDPARVLREVEAKRRIVGRHQYVSYPDPDMSHGDVELCTYCEVRWPCPDILDQAAPYADRPGYRDEWKP